MFLSGKKIEGEKCMSAEGSGVKGSNKQSFTSFPRVKGGGPLFSGRGPLITGGLVNDTTPVLTSSGGHRNAYGWQTESYCNPVLFTGKRSGWFYEN